MVDMNKKSMVELAELIAESVVVALEKRGAIGKGTITDGRPKKSAYQRTEQLLYNYMGFKKIVAERLEEIENIKKYGVPQRSASIVEYSAHTGTVGSIVLPEESVEIAVQRIQDTVQDTVQAISLVDKGMDTLKTDPYYKVLEMVYFEKRTQEEIAMEFNVSQVTISTNKKRLVRELSMQLFPNQVVDEMLN